MADHLEPMDPFEHDLSRLLRDASDRALRPFDPSSVARAAVGPSVVGGRSRRADTRRLLLVAAAAVLGAAAAGGVLVVANRERGPEPPSVPPQVPAVVIASPSDLAPTPPPTTEPIDGPTASPTATATDAPTTRPGDTAPPTITACAPQGPNGTASWGLAQPVVPDRLANGLLAGIAGLRDDGSISATAGLYTVDATDGDQEILARVTDASGRILGLSWSPSGRQLALTTGSGEGFGSCTGIAVIADRVITPVDTMRGSGGWAWGPDGTAIVRLGPTPTLYRSDGTSAPLLEACGDDCMWELDGWSPDGVHLALTRATDAGSGGIVIRDSGTGAMMDLPGADKGVFYGWLDNGTVLVMQGAFSPSGKVHWAAIGLDGSVSDPGLPVSATIASQLTMSPDLQAAAGQRCLRCPFESRTADGRHVLWTGPDPIAMAWSPDSRFVAFSVRGGRDHAGTWVVGRDGSGLRRVTTRVLDVLAWGPDAP